VSTVLSRYGLDAPYDVRNLGRRQALLRSGSPPSMVTLRDHPRGRLRVSARPYAQARARRET
jgi:hypothetical protein